MDEDDDGKISFDEFVDFIYTTKHRGSQQPQIKVVSSNSPPPSPRDRATSSLKIGQVSFDGGSVQRPRSEPDGGTRSRGQGRHVSIRDAALAKATARRGHPPRRPSNSPAPS